MDRVAGDRGDVDDDALALVQGLCKAARQLQRREEIELEHFAPGIDVAVEDAETFLEAGLRADRGVVDQGMDRLAAQDAQRLVHETVRLLWLAQIDRDVVSPVRIVFAFFRDRIAAAGYDAPAFLAEALDRGVADAAAGAGEDDGFPGFSAHL